MKNYFLIMSIFSLALVASDKSLQTLIKSPHKLKRFASWLGIKDLNWKEKLLQELNLDPQLITWSSGPDSIIIEGKFSVDPITWKVLDAGEWNWIFTITVIRDRLKNPETYEIYVIHPTVRYYRSVNREFFTEAFEASQETGVLNPAHRISQWLKILDPRAARYGE